MINFEINNIPENELPFILEVLDILGTESFEFFDLTETNNITIDNVIPLIIQHEKFPKFYQKQLNNEISFVSSHFYELCETKEEEFMKFQISTIESILNSTEIQLKDEDQLIKFINKLYSFDSKYVVLYENVIFSNVSSSKMNEFVCLFDVNKITNELWIKLSKRLTEEIKSDDKTEEQSERYKSEVKKLSGMKIEYSENKDFTGIIKHLISLNEVIEITSSSNYNTFGKPLNVIDYNNNNQFCSNNIENSWLCFDFKDHRIILSDYQMMSVNWGENWNPKSWVIEGSLDKNSWEILDEQTNCSSLKNGNSTQKFTINKQISKEFRYIRLRQTDKNWSNTYYFSVRKVEFFGELI